MAKSTKKFFITETTRKYDGSVKYTPKCYKRFSTREEAEIYAERLNKQNSKEACEAMYRSWVADPADAWATESWYEHMKKTEAFYRTYEVKESK